MYILSKLASMIRSQQHMTLTNITKSNNINYAAQISPKEIAWSSLQNNTIINRNVILTGYDVPFIFRDATRLTPFKIFSYDSLHKGYKTISVDHIPEKNYPIFKSENVFFEKCDKYFIGSWMNTCTFPLVKNVFLNSHPCDSHIIRNILLKNNGVNVYLHKRYSIYKHHWFFMNDNVQVISDVDYQKHLLSYEDEILKFETLEKYPIQIFF